MSTFFRRYWPLLLATLVLVPHAWLFDFVNDDAYISFRYARNFALEGQPVYNLGERVEGYTNFLWMVLLAGGIKLGISPVLTSRFFGVAFAVATLAVITRWGQWLHPSDQPGRTGKTSDNGATWPSAMAPLVLGTTSAFACYCSSGLESQMFTFFVTAGVCLFLRELDHGVASSAPPLNPDAPIPAEVPTKMPSKMASKMPTAFPWSAPVLALAAMTRPEGLFFFGLAGLFRLTHLFFAPGRRKAFWALVTWAGTFVVFFAPYFAWRWNYYGWPFPNTFYAKASSAGTPWTYGLYYLRRLFEDHGGIFVALVLIAGLGFGRFARRQLTLVIWAVFCAGAFLYYVGRVGGDFMGLYRFALPIFPLVALALQTAVMGIWARLSAQGRVGTWVLVVVVMIGFGGHVLGMSRVTQTATTFIGADHGIDTPAYLRRFVEDRIPIGIWLAKNSLPSDSMTMGGAGVIAYYAGIPGHDVFGLVDETIAHDPKMTVGSRPGHQKRGTQAHMLSRKPTMLHHRYRLHGWHRPNPNEVRYWAQRGYAWRSVLIPGLSPPFYSYLHRVPWNFLAPTKQNPAQNSAVKITKAPKP